MFIHTGYEYRCTLPNDGYFSIRWDEKVKKIHMLHFQPQSKQKTKSKKILRIHAEDNN